MGSPLRDLQNILSGSRDQLKTGTVIQANAGRLVLRLSSGGQATIFGTADLGARVVFKGEQLLGVLRSEESIRVSIP